MTLLQKLCSSIAKRTGKRVSFKTATDSTEIYLRVGKLRRTLGLTDIEALMNGDPEALAERLFP